MQNRHIVALFAFLAAANYHALAYLDTRVMHGSDLVARSPHPAAYFDDDSLYTHDAFLEEHGLYGRDAEAYGLDASDLYARDIRTKLGRRDIIPCRTCGGMFFFHEDMKSNDQRCGTCIKFTAAGRTGKQSTQQKIDAASVKAAGGACAWCRANKKKCTHV